LTNINFVSNPLENVDYEVTLFHIRQRLKVVLVNQNSNLSSSYHASQVPSIKHTLSLVHILNLYPIVNPFSILSFMNSPLPFVK